MSANSNGNQNNDRRRWRQRPREDRRDKTPAAHESSQQEPHQFVTGMQNQAMVPQFQGMQQLMQPGAANAVWDWDASFIQTPAGHDAPQYGMQPGYSMMPALPVQQPYSYGNHYAPRPLQEQGNGREDKRKREDARDVRQEGASNTKQKEKQPANEAKERATRHCKNCGRDVHWLKDCIGPVNPSTDMLDGCPWCEVKDMKPMAVM